jgi:predicted  nucleic acid-binding Zn ribbon protein
MQDDDLFDAVVSIEQTAYQRGFAEGKLMAEARDQKESYDLGYSRGYTIGRELGFYLGVVEALTEEPLLPHQQKLLQKLSAANTKAMEDPSEVCLAKGAFKLLVTGLKSSQPRWLSELF